MCWLPLLFVHVEQSQSLKEGSKMFIKFNILKIFTTKVAARLPLVKYEKYKICNIVKVFCLDVSIQNIENDSDFYRLNTKLEDFQ